MNENINVNVIEALLDDISLRKNLSIDLSNNHQTRHETIQILNKLCIHSPDGYDKTIEIFNYYKSLKKERFKFKCLIDTLLQLNESHLDNDISSLSQTEKEEYIYDILKLINCLVNKSKQVHERIRIRYEFIGLKLIDFFKNINESYLKSSIISEEINLFLRHSDEFTTNDVDLNNHFDIFFAIYSQVLGTAHETTFLCLLRHLLRIDNTNKISNVIWEVIEKLVCRATVFDRDEHVIGVTLERYADEKFKNLLQEPEKNLVKPESTAIMQSFTTPPPAPPLPPPPPPPPPPFLPLNFFQETHNSNQQDCDNSNNNKKEIDNDTARNEAQNSTQNTENNQSNIITNINEISELILPQQCVPKANTKMIKCIWSKIHPNRIIGKQNLWTKFTNRFEEQSTNDTDDKNVTYFQEIEEYFKTSENPRAEAQIKDPNLKETKIWNSSEKINLLDSKRSLNINIYLKQFRCSPDDIVHLLSNNENQELGLENLEGMLKILPDANEIELLKLYQGDVDKLAEAELFLFKLIQVQDYKLRIESLLLKEEFNSQMLYFNKSFDNIFKAADTIYNNFNLAKMMIQICKTGNFINEGSYSGNAAGFKLSSLLKLSDLKSNKHNITLLHVIIQQLQEKDSKLLELPNELTALKDVTAIQLENLRNEVGSFCNRVKKLNQQIENVENWQLIQLKEFIESAYCTISTLEKKETDLESWKLRLAEFFCEEFSSFRIEDCFNILFKFCEKMKAILQENQEKRCCELRRSNGPRITRIFNNDNTTNALQRTNSSMKTRKLNRNASESFCCMSSLDREKSRKANNSEDDHSAATDSNDLDEYATYNECNLIRRSNPVRMSRKLALNRIITQSNVSNSAANLSHQNLMEASYLLDFLNKGLEQNGRELPTSRASLNTASNVELNKTLIYSNENNDLNENPNELTKSISPTSFLKRHSSAGCLNSNLKLKLISDKTDADDKVSQETICYQGMSSSNNLDSYFNETQINLDPKVILRRSSSTSECDLICNKFNFRNRREIASAVLHEESTNNNSSCDLNESTLSQSTRSQSKSSNRLSGLKKLGTLYKTFEDDDFNVSKNRKSIYKNDQSDYCLNSSTNTIDIDSAQFYSPQQNPNIKSNLDAKRALFETKLISNSNLGSNVAPCLSSSIVTNRIMKFETQRQTSSESMLENNCVKKINSVKMQSLESSSLSSSICENEKSSSIYSSLSSSPVPKLLTGDNWTSNYLEKQQKVKSLSKNWELIANKNNAKNSEKTFNTRPTKVIEKIERLNSTNLIQLISQQQQHDLGDLINSSSGNSSDDNETSKDDGFETQSNASSSQACDINSVQSIKLTDTSNQQIDMEVDNLTKTSHEIVSAFKPINNTENKTENESEDKAEPRSNNKKLNTIVTIVTKGKTISATVMKRPSKCSQERNESNLQLNSSISSNHIGSMDEASKRKSGSMLGLYLSDTASTKARKAETKHSFKLTNNLNIQMQSASIHNITNSCSISSSIKRQQVINRKSSVHQKSTEKLNLQSSSTISLPSKELTINSKVKKNHSISKDNSVFDRLAKSSSKSLKLK